jgi:hypothetical protein
MIVELTPESIVTAGAVCTAAALLISKFAKGVRWFDQQGKQSTDIATLKKKHEEDVADLRDELADEIRKNNNELQLLTYGVLACLKGLQEKGCNGPVTEAVNKIEGYLNKKAHE